MKMQRCLAASLVLWALLSGQASGLSFNAEDAKNRPVSKVIVLLKDMMKALEKEAEEDEEMYDKMRCWCETNDKSKAKEIAESEARIAMLTTKVDELTALVSRLGAECKQLKKELAANEESLAKATAIREKEAAEFKAEEQDLLESISSLKAAVAVLSKHHGGASMLNVATTLQNAIQKHAALLRGVLTHSERKLADSFIQAPTQSANSYDAGSGEIYGILTQMLESFEENLAAAQKAETASQKAFTELKSAKEEEIAAGQAQFDKKWEQLADTKVKNAQTKRDIEDTKETLAADRKYGAILREKCPVFDKEWAERQKTRQLEMEAVSKALATLSGDDAHDLFSRTFNPSLLQMQSSAESARRAQASRVLSSVAQKLRNPRLVALAVQVKLDAFEKVKKAIDDMVSDLAKEQEDETKQKETCAADLRENTLQTRGKEREKKDLLAKLEDVESAIKELTNNMESLKGQIVDLQVQLKKAGENREKENREFQLALSDQRETQILLKRALKVLQGFYNKNALLQTQGPDDIPPPPPGFGAYKKNDASSGVMAMIQQIITDAEKMQTEITVSEQNAQKAYEAFVKETNGSIETKQKDVAHKAGEKAKADSALAEAKDAKDTVLEELAQLSKLNMELHQGCDYIMKNFELRQTARAEEMDSLKQAKAILSGAKFAEFLQDA